MSDEYSKPGFNILTSLTRLIVFESGNKLAFVPCVDAMLTNEGKLLYPTPSKLITTLSIAPDAFGDSVVYFKNACLLNYKIIFLVFSDRETLNDVDPDDTLKIQIVFKYTIFII